MLCRVTIENDLNTAVANVERGPPNVWVESRPAGDESLFFVSLRKNAHQAHNPPRGNGLTVVNAHVGVARRLLQISESVRVTRRRFDAADGYTYTYLH